MEAHNKKENVENNHCAKPKWIDKKAQNVRLYEKMPVKYCIEQPYIVANIFSIIIAVLFANVCASNVHPIQIHGAAKDTHTHAHTHRHF